jgi:hypothetical protein
VAASPAVPDDADDQTRIEHAYILAAMEETQYEVLRNLD